MLVTMVTQSPLSMSLSINFCCLVIYDRYQQGQCILSSVVFTPSLFSHHGSVWVLPLISLLFSGTDSPVRACLFIGWERFRGTQQKDDLGPLGIKSSPTGTNDTGDEFFLPVSTTSVKIVRRCQWRWH